MKETRQNIFDALSQWYDSKFKAPEDCKLSMAEANLNSMMVALPLLITLGVFGVTFLLIKTYGNYSESYARFIYYGAHSILGLVTLLISIKFRKETFLRASIKMIPTHFLFGYLMIFPLYLFFYEKNLINTMLVFACISVNFPIFFNISPAHYCLFVTIESAIFIPTISKNFNAFITIDSFIFLIILYILSFKRWGTEKDNFLHHRSEHEYKENVEKELKLANVVQQSFFKHNDTIYNDWAISYYNKPMTGVSGDFLDIYGNGNILEGIGIFDVSGHGIASGLVTMLVKNIIFQEFYNGKEDKLKSIIDRINLRYIKEKGNIENYLTGILTRLNGNSVEFINAGHSMPVFYSAKDDNAFYLEDKNNAAFGAIGLPDIPTNFVSHTVEMNRGDELIFFTDGATEATNADGEDFGKDRLLRSIFRNADRPLTTQINCIISDILTFIGDEPRKDDITIIILKKK